MINNDTLYWIWLAEKCGVESKDFGRLISRFNNPFDIYQLEDFEIEQLNISESLRDALCQKSLDEASEIVKICKREGIDVIGYGDKEYPKSLRMLIDPPIVLYCRGHFPDFNTPVCIGVVGTRNMSEYGRQNAYKYTYDIAKSGAYIVSGMALGIDGVAACGALAAGGFTVAVLGCGVDVAYPKHHTRLMEEIIRHGAVISEFPPRTEPRGYNFPKRNRIISGLCEGVLVVEAAAKSGALITAEDAIGQGREVFAIPGKLTDEGAAGPNGLIKKGCYPAHSSADIIKHYELRYADDVSSENLERYQSERPDIDEVLKKYGLFYALSKGETPVEPTFSLKKGSRAQSARTVAPSKEKASAKAEKKSNTAPAERKKPEPREGWLEERARDAAELLETMDDTMRSVLEAIPIDRPIAPDAIKVPGVSAIDLVATLTMLEIHGLIEALPGGVYVRK